VVADFQRRVDAIREEVLVKARLDALFSKYQRWLEVRRLGEA
jgi:hypothetical protein